VVCRYHLALAGPLPAAVAGVIRARFGAVTISSAAGRTVLDGVLADQAAVRALLTLVWDVGAEVRLLRVGAAGGGAGTSAAGRPGVCDTGAT
jgi:hypothetical protein